MKKFTSFCTLLLMAMMPLAITSCGDEDDAIANDLSGFYGKAWSGYIGSYYADRFGKYGSEYRTTIQFNSDGTGYEVDYNVNSRYSDNYYCEFRWTVYDRTITIQYADSYNPVYIYDFTLGYDYFEGYMDDGTGRDIYFRLNLVEDFDWNPYWYDTYWAKPASRAAAADEPQKVKFAARGEFAE